jgi:hypothetical protein
MHEADRHVGTRHNSEPGMMAQLVDGSLDWNPVSYPGRQNVERSGRNLKRQMCYRIGDDVGPRDPRFFLKSNCITRLSASRRTGSGK